MNGEQAFETLRRVLAEIGWDSDPDEETNSFYVDFASLGSPVADAVAAIASDTERFAFYVNFAPEAPRHLRDEVARFVARANWGLTIGNFELDYDSGRIRFKSSLDFGNADLDEALIRNAILAAMTAVEAHAEALLRVLAGTSAEQAIEQVERE